jgi:hypothetical protein
MNGEDFSHCERSAKSRNPQGKWPKCKDKTNEYGQVRQNPSVIDVALQYAFTTSSGFDPDGVFQANDKSQNRSARSKVMGMI